MNSNEKRKALLKAIRLTFFAFVAVYMLMMLFTFTQQRNMMYVPNRSAPDIAKAPAGTESITVRTTDQIDLHSWWYPPRNEDSLTIVFFHGNAGNLENRLPKATRMINNGYGVLLASYRGYGGNEGKPTEDNLYKDARAHMHWLIENKGYDIGNIVIYGESLGSGIATQMAMEFNQAKALILDVPFNSTVAIAKHRFPALAGIDIMMKDQYRNDLKIASINMPLLLGTAGKDFIVPSKFGKALYSLARQPKLHIHYADSYHSVLEEHGFIDDMDLFLQQF